MVIKFKIYSVLAYIITIVIVSGSQIQYIQNSDLSQHTSIFDISHWYVTDSWNILQSQSLYNDWKLTPYTDYFQGPSHTFFINLFFQCIVQVIPQVPAGDIKLSGLGFVIPEANIQSISYPFQIKFEYQNMTVIHAQSFKPTSKGHLFNMQMIFTITTPVTNARVHFCNHNTKDTILLTHTKLYVYSSLTHCQKTQTFGNGTTTVCLVCQQGYVIDQYGKCVAQVTYCSTYKTGVCSQCIKGYFLRNNTCIKQSTQCQTTDSKGWCIKCLDEFSVQNGLCIKNVIIPTCTSSQFLTADNECVQGNVINCAQYLSPSGQCKECKTSYKLNAQRHCVFTCPSDTTTQKYILQNGGCILTDINCISVNQDGYCAVCSDKFYPKDGKCYSLQSQQTISFQSSLQTVQQTDQLKKDQAENYYLLRADGSRIYISGPWKNLQVWSDNENNLYVKVANGGRQYLTGANQGLISYQDSNGYWYVINANGQKVYQNKDSQTSNLRN